MPTTNPTPNMDLPVPVVGVDPGPDWADNINSCMIILDAHTHASGSGVKITPDGININKDLPLNQNNLISARSVRMSAQSNPLSGPSDLGCAYVSGEDLWFNDENGNQIQITKDGGVAGTPGSIGNLTSPASATYVPGSQTFVWEANTNLPANMDSGPVTIRKNSTNSDGITISPPLSIASNYNLTLPPLPASQKFMTLDNSGNITAPWAVDNSTIEVNSNTVQVKAGGITPTQIENGFGLVPTGSIIPFGGTVAPTGWLLCDGSAISRTTFSTLFTAIGTAFGAGNGTTTFNLPGPQGYFMRFVSGSSGRDPDASSRTAMASGGNTGNNVGSVQLDAVGTHAHQVHTVAGGPSDNNVAYGFASTTAADVPNAANTITSGRTSSETRGTNFYVNAIIKY